MTDWKRYTGEFSPQYQNEPEPPTIAEQLKKAKPGDAIYWNDPASKPKPITGRHFEGIITDDLVDDPPKDPRYGPEVQDALKRRLMYQKWLDYNKSKKEVKMSEDEQLNDCEEMTLYEVVTVNGEDRNNVIVEVEHVVAESEDRAILRSSFVIPDDWDMDYVVREAVEVCSVRVKRKPREILKA